MATLVVKNLPNGLHARLKRQAEQNHRSLNKEVVRLIEQSLVGKSPTRLPLPPPIKLRGGPITLREIETAIAAGRD